MRDKRLINLFSLLEKEEYQTAEAIALQFGVSSKTIRNLIRNLDECLENKGAHIHSKNGAGYKIVIDDFEKFQSFKKTFTDQCDNKYLPETSEERIKYLLEYLLNSKGYIKLEELSDSLYVCKPTLSADLKKVEKLLNKYNLTLVRKPNYGIKVEGKEFHLRLCIANYIAEEGTAGFLKKSDKEDGDDMKIIAGCVSECLREREFVMSDIAFRNLIVHIYIAIKRIEANYYIPLEEDDIKQFVGQKEYAVANEIVSKINKIFNLEFPQSEISYVAIHLAGKKMEEGTSPSAKNLVISQEVSDIVTEMLQLVYDSFKFDFRRDLDLRIALSQHIVPLKVRIQYDMNMKNPLLKDIKERFSLAYAMASEACIVINQYYKKKLGEDEIGYIALSFALALERQRTEIAKKNILLVCSSGKGSAQLLLYKYKEEFRDYINHIETCDINGLYKIDFSKIDYVFTTVPINIEIPVPIQEIRFFLEDSDIRVVKKMLFKDKVNSMEQYYKKELFLPNLKCKSKEEALRSMCDYVMERKGLPKSFYASVLKRESLAKTEFGNMVAMPHPHEAVSEDTFVCVGILEEPIQWEDGEVQVIFLVSIENKEGKNLQKFYRVTSKFLLNQKYIQELIKKRDFDKFIDLLRTIEMEMEEKDYGR